MLLFFRYADRPGRGRRDRLDRSARPGVNIAAMQVARRDAGGEALMALTVDSLGGRRAAVAVAAAIGSSRAAVVDLRAD